MIKITFNNNTFEEIPAEFYKNEALKSTYFDTEIRKVTEITIPKEIGELDFCVVRNLVLNLEEGIEVIKIWNYNAESIKIPMSCTNLTLINCRLKTLFVPKGVKIFDTCLKTGEEYNYSTVIEKCWVDGENTKINYHNNYCNLIGFRSIRIHPTYDSKGIPFYVPFNCEYNEPLTNIVNKNLFNEVVNSKAYICKESNNGVKVGIQLTKKQYLEKFGDEKCEFKPTY